MTPCVALQNMMTGRKYEIATKKPLYAFYTKITNITL